MTDTIDRESGQNYVALIVLRGTYTVGQFVASAYSERGRYIGQGQATRPTVAIARVKVLALHRGVTVPEDVPVRDTVTPKFKAKRRGES